MKAAPAPRRITPGVEIVPADQGRTPARVAAVQSGQAPSVVAYTSGQGGATASGPSQQRFTEAFTDWQTDAKAAARTVGVARFTANMFALTAARVRLTVEYDQGGGEWDEAEDDRYAGIMADYRNETLNQSSAELQRLHAWHYQVAGEGLVCNHEAPNSGGAEWMVLSHRAVEWDRPQAGMATVRLTPNGSLQNALAFATTRNMLVRFWLPDEEFALLPVSPMTAAMDDLRRWLDLTRYARRVALNYLTMNGLLWTPKNAHESETEATDEIIAEAEGVAPQVKDDPLVALYKQIASTSIANDDRMESVTPTMVWWGDSGDQPVWVDIGKGLDAEGLAHRAEALGDYARDVDAPAALVQGGGTDMASSHWGAWLTEERFHGSIAPLLDRMFHQDLTAFYLAPLLRLRGVQERDLVRWRVGYDPTDVIVHPDKSDLAMRAYLAGLLKDTVALKEMGWNPDTDLADTPSLERLAFVLTRGTSTMPGATPGETPGAGGQPSLDAGPVPDAPVTAPTTIEAPPPSSPAAPGLAATIGAFDPAALVDEVLGPYAAYWPPAEAHTASAGAGSATVTLTAERDSEGTPPTGVGAATAPPTPPETPVQGFGVAAPRTAAAHLARVHPRTDAQKAIGAEMRQYRRLVTRLSKLRADTTRKLLAGAEVAFAEAMRLAGIRAVQKGRNKSRAKVAEMEVAWGNSEPVRPHLAALGITEEQILAGAFDSYEQQATEWLRARTERERTLIEEAGYDPDVVLPGEQDDQDLAAAAFLGITLMALARQRLMSGSDPITLAGPGEVSGMIPAQYGVAAMRISDGISGYTPAGSADHLPTIHAIQGRGTAEDMLAVDIRDRMRDLLHSELVAAEGDARTRLEEAVTAFGDAPTEYVWTWGFYGDPVTPFEPHLALDGYTTVDPEGDPNLYNGEPFPESQMFSPGDHLGCTCEWVAQVGAGVEPTTTNALGPEEALSIPGGRDDASALANDLRAEAARITE